MSKWPEPRPIGGKRRKLECILAYVYVPRIKRSAPQKGRWLLMAATAGQRKIDGFTVLGTNPAADRWFPCSILQPTHFYPATSASAGGAAKRTGTSSSTRRENYNRGRVRNYFSCRKGQQGSRAVPFTDRARIHPRGGRENRMVRERFPFHRQERASVNTASATTAAARSQRRYEQFAKRTMGEVW